jgi:hypothetical protein
LLFDQIELVSVDSPRNDVLGAKVDVYVDSTSVLCFKAKPVNNVGVPVSIDVLGPYQLFKFLYPY